MTCFTNNEGINISSVSNFQAQFILTNLVFSLVLSAAEILSEMDDISTKPY